ncbi:hypothetical protein SBF1_7570005 [Candidatus Desulfosporosinus infrequens]|uniref:DNA-directed DNA polymerase n=1 Tax=Candidatus Desulfosporosinus infrequens TaxID=2043169 RepID=A0A2U3LRA7_9FIRM|nr:hypothetical protein SBF1_7570005 [Candidatus Desulfosporosinus infrequens]
MNSHLIEKVASALIHCPFQIQHMINRINQLEGAPEDEKIFSDLMTWLLSKAGDI